MPLKSPLYLLPHHTSKLSSRYQIHVTDPFLIMDIHMPSHQEDHHHVTKLKGQIIGLT
jgi:hypothetical protein